MQQIDLLMFWPNLLFGYAANRNLLIWMLKWTFFPCICPMRTCAQSIFKCSWGMAHKRCPCHTTPEAASWLNSSVTCAMEQYHPPSRYSRHSSWRSHSCCVLLILTQRPVSYIELNVAFCTSVYDFCCEQMISKSKESSGKVKFRDKARKPYI